MPLRPMLKPLSLFVSLAGCLLLASGCSVITPSEPTRFYVLSTAEEAPDIKGSKQLPETIQVGVGPIEIPGYVDRPQIVTFGQGNRLVVADLDHWAEPIQKNVERILVSNLSSLISSQQVFSYPANFQPASDSLQVSVEIREMTRTAAGVARLVVSWNVKRMLDNRLLVRKAETFETQTATGDYAAYAADMSKLFNQLSQRIVMSLDEAGV